MEGLTIEQALERADRSHPEFAHARAQTDAAEGRAIQALIAPNPVGVARLETAPLDGNAASDGEAVLGISQRFQLGDKRGAARRVEEADRDRLLRELEARRLEVHRRVRGAFAAALYAERTTRTQAGLVEAGERAVEVTQARREAGDALPEDLARSAMELARDRLELERSRSLHQQALAVLATAIGEEGLRVLSVEGNLEAAIELPILQDLVQRLSGHPALAAAEKDVILQRTRMLYAEVQKIPDINLDLFYRRVDSVEKDRFDLGLGIPLPLFDRQQGRLREARADIVAAEARTRLARTVLETSLREAHGRIERALATVRVLRDEIVSRSHTILEAAEARYAHGDTSLSDVLFVRRDHRNAELAYLESLRALMEAWADLSPFIRTETYVP